MSSLYGDANPSLRPEVRAKMSAVLKGKSRNKWTAEELNTLRNLYSTAPVASLIELLPLHSWGSIKAKAKELGVTRLWTDKEVRLLLSIFPSLAKRGIETLFPRHSWIGISRKARRLGLWRHPRTIATERKAHRNGRRLTVETIVGISNLHTKGLSKRRIVEELGVGIATVELYLCPERRARVNEKRRQGRQKAISGRHRRTISTLATHVGSKEILLQGLHKREKPNVCEICKRPFQLSYHHWSDNPNIGMWICAPCHQVATNIEAGFSDRYNKLKAAVETEASQWQEQFIARLI